VPDLIPILDTHQHLVYPDQWPYSWTTSIPALARRAFRYEDYQSAVAGTGITGSIFMETTPDFPHWKKEANFVYKLPKEIRGAIANCQPELPGLAEYIDTIADPRLVGFRRILHVDPDELSQSPLFAENLRLLGKRNFTFDLCIRPGQIPLAINLLRKCPNVQFILDHCGNPDIAAGDSAAATWCDALRQIAAEPNLACKISGIVANCKPGTVTSDLLRPYVEHCLDCFGWDRVVWGSDWPVCLTACALSDWVTHTRQIVSSATPADRRKLFHENAARIYRLR
jgi:predicted TIM-barrel fold metal-dependent hydrolase